MMVDPVRRLSTLKGCRGALVRAVVSLGKECSISSLDLFTQIQYLLERKEQPVKTTLTHLKQHNIPLWLPRFPSTLNDKDPVIFRTAVP